MPERTALALFLEWLAIMSPTIYVAVISGAIAAMRLRRSGGSWGSATLEGMTLGCMILLLYPALVDYTQSGNFAAAVSGVLSLYGTRAIAAAARPALSIIAAIAQSQGGGKK